MIFLTTSFGMFFSVECIKGFQQRQSQNTTETGSSVRFETGDQVEKDVQAEQLGPSESDEIVAGQDYEQVSENVG